MHICWAKKSSTIVPLRGFKHPETLIFTTLPEWLFSSLQALFWLSNTLEVKTHAILRLPSTFLSCSKKNSVKKLDLSSNLHLSTDFVVKEASFINLESSSHPARKIAHKSPVGFVYSMWFRCDDILQTTCNQYHKRHEKTNYNLTSHSLGIIVPFWFPPLGTRPRVSHAFHPWNVQAQGVHRSAAWGMISLIGLHEYFL